MAPIFIIRLKSSSVSFFVWFFLSPHGWLKCCSFRRFFNAHCNRNSNSKLSLCFNESFCFSLLFTEESVHRSRDILGLVEPENTTELETGTVESHSLFDGHKECNKPAIFEIPSDGLTREQRQGGWIAVHFVLAIYCFWFLATICDEYFVPCIQSICSSFNLNEGKANMFYG